jgi:hypothetical protein
VALTIGKADGVGDETIRFGYCHAGGGIQSAAIQYYRFLLHDKGLRVRVVNFMDCNFTRIKYNKSTFLMNPRRKKVKSSYR